MKNQSGHHFIHFYPLFGSGYFFAFFLDILTVIFLIRINLLQS